MSIEMMTMMMMMMSPGQRVTRSSYLLLCDGIGWYLSKPPVNAHGRQQVQTNQSSFRVVIS